MRILFIIYSYYYLSFQRKFNLQIFKFFPPVTYHKISPATKASVFNNKAILKILHNNRNPYHFTIFRNHMKYCNAESERNKFGNGNIFYYLSST